MRLSGVDPGIIRELSGIYKPFIKAFKELISNAYDADAKNVLVSVAEDLTAIEVRDDGNGMSPYQFHKDFARLGGSTAWLRGGKSPGGRQRIGYKGIGFLAVARYCSSLTVESRSVRAYAGQQTVRRRNRTSSLPLAEIVGELVPLEHVRGHVRVTSMTAVVRGEKMALKPKRDFKLVDDRIRLLSNKARRAQRYLIKYRVDCKHLVLKAQLDFDYLLSLEHRADLRLLDDFCTIRLEPSEDAPEHFTRIQLRGLKDFVMRELGAPALKGKARNIAFKSGKEQFLWRLARSAPLADNLPDDLPCAPMARMRDLQDTFDLPSLRVRWRDEEPVELRRPVHVPKKVADLDDTTIAIDISERGLRAVGYLLPRSEVIYPAELRGLSVRVRNVAIGDASFFGWETMMSGSQKAAMGQISGEIIVLDGLDASDAINPGRESFYEENDQYRVLKTALFGSGDSIGGAVKQGIRSILERIHVRGQVTGKVTAAKQRRKCLSDISTAVNHYSRGSDPAAKHLAAFFAQRVTANGLSRTRNRQMRPGHKLAGFEVENVAGLQQDYEVDYSARKVRLDFTQNIWDQNVYLNGHYYEVQIKNGKPEHPICEFDNEERHIYVNWGHPVKLNMDDAAFLKSAILLRLANHAAPHDADAMMNLALNMLAFRAE